MTNSIITGTGSYIPNINIPNSHFLDHSFYNEEGIKQNRSNEDIIKKFNEITCIKERRYSKSELRTSDLASFAAEKALEGVDRESIDCIIVGHNFGDVTHGNVRTDIVPSIASRVKYKLGIKNPYAIAFDVIFGCPGWLHGMILADYYIKAKDAKKVLVIGAESLSRVSDPHDMDCMIYSDGAGATLVESTEEDAGIITHITRTDSLDEAYLLWLGKSYNRDYPGDELFLKMHGHQVYKYAVKKVPEVARQCLDKAGLDLSDIKKVFIHQANEKMDDAILKRLFKLYKVKEIPKHIMPMTISWLGNNSVATLPTMFDLLQKGKLKNHKLHSGDIALFASVGAGMNINAMVYKML